MAGVSAGAGTHGAFRHSVDSFTSISHVGTSRTFTYLGEGLDEYACIRQYGTAKYCRGQQRTEMCFQFQVGNTLDKMGGIYLVNLYILDYEIDGNMKLFNSIPGLMKTYFNPWFTIINDYDKVGPVLM